MTGEHAMELDPALQALIDAPDWRVMYQFYNPTDPGPHFGFTTLRGNSEAEVTEAFLSGATATHNRNFTVVQVVESNGVSTGFTEASVAAQLTPEELAFLERKTASEEQFWISEKEARDADATDPR